MDRCLWFGLEAPKGFVADALIEVAALPFEDKAHQAKLADAVVFTSKTAVRFFCASFKSFLRGKMIAATGESTARCLRQEGIDVHFVPKLESQEGLIEEVFCHSALCWFWPKSKLSRPLLQNYFINAKKRLIEVDVYKVSYKKSRFSYEELLSFSSFAFTSPSTVDSYFSQFHAIPSGIQVFVQGEVTKAHLLSRYPFVKGIEMPASEACLIDKKSYSP